MAPSKTAAVKTRKESVVAMRLNVLHEGWLDGVAG
jgi:hypothetical protein